MSLYEKKCPVEDIAAYIDGELDAAREAEIEAHFATCDDCNLELNLQKRFICSVSSGLKDQGVMELPIDFAKKIAVNAESTVSGLRPSRERFNAMFICAALSLFALFALGTEARDFLNLAYGLFEQTAAVGSLLGHLLYSFFLGVAIVLRGIASRAGFESAAAVIFATACVVAALRFRRRFIRLLRV